MKPNEIAERLIKNLPGGEYLSPAEIIQAGVFGSHTGLTRCIREKKISCLRISKRRVLIHRESVVHFIRSCANES